MMRRIKRSAGKTDMDISATARADVRALKAAFRKEIRRREAALDENILKIPTRAYMILFQCFRK
jgi:hypothetical protein